MNQIFHVHTFRCGHAQRVPDEAYVKAAVKLGASDIWFTDHAPFPDNPFGARMQMHQLDEYIKTLSALKQKYSDIQIHIGLETEYFPNFDQSGYYRELADRPEIEMRLLGQHMAEISAEPLAYSFSKDWEYLCQNEYKLLGNAIVQGIESGYFHAVAHPDRIFRRSGAWDSHMAETANAIIQAAVRADIPLEMNLCSAESPVHYKRQFWQLVPDTAKRIIGFDAHSIDEMNLRYENMPELLNVFA